MVAGFDMATARKRTVLASASRPFKPESCALLGLILSRIACTIAAAFEEVGMLETETLTALFRDLVRSAMATLRVDSTETTEFYLVRLLEAFTRPGRGDLLDPPLAVDYLEAFQLPASQRCGKLRRVADTALFVTGVFVDSLDRKL